MSQPGPAEEPNRPHWTVASVALFVIGLLILLLSGLCTAWGLVFAIGALAVGDVSLLAVVLIVGGVPLALGIALVLWGLRLRRRD